MESVAAAAELRWCFLWPCRRPVPGGHPKVHSRQERDDRQAFRGRGSEAGGGRAAQAGERGMCAPWRWAARGPRE